MENDYSITLRFILFTTVIILGHQTEHPSVAEAIKASPHPFHDIDQNGRLTPPIYIRGDESFHWEEDENGYTLIDDPSYVSKKGRRKRMYAKIKGDKLISSGIVFGDSMLKNKDIKKLAKHIKPAEKIRRSQCGPFCESGAFNHTLGKPSLPIDNRRNHEEHANRRRRILTNGFPSQSSLKNLALLIRFADHTTRVLPPPSHYKILLNGPAGPGTVAPTGSVEDVFMANSYGTFHINSTVTQWIIVSRTEAYYADGKSGLGPKIFEVSSACKFTMIAQDSPCSQCFRPSTRHWM